MSISDASRAATGAPATGAPSLSSSRALQQGPTELRLVAADPDALRFEGHTRLQAPVLLCPLLAALGSLPWLGFVPLDPVRLTLSLAFHGAAIALLIWGWPRPVQATLRPRARELSVAGRQRLLCESSRWVLDCWHDDTTAPRGCYVAALELQSGERWPLLRGAEPDVVLRELRRVLDYSPQPVECLWGLTEGARPWSFEDEGVPPPRGAAGGVQRICGREASGALVRVMWLTSLLVLLDLIWLVASQHAALSYIHPFGVALPATFAITLLALTAHLTTRRTCLAVSGGVSWREVQRFGRAKLGSAVRLEDVRGVHLIGAEAADQRHVLIDTARGPMALAVPASSAEATLRQARRALSAASTDTRSRPPRALTRSGVHDKPAP